MTNTVLTTYSTIGLLTAALSRRGYTHDDVLLDGRTYTRLTSPAGASWLTSNTQITYPFPTAGARPICDNKRLAYQLVADMGFSVPRTFVVTADMQMQDDIVAMLQYAPLVVKPDNASLARGVTLNINDAAALQQAITTARLFSETVLIQRQIEGEEVRIAVIDGKATAAVLRQAPRVVGDGVSTLDQLLKAENKARRGLRLPYLHYPELNADIIDFSTFDVSSVPSAEEIVRLRRTAMIRQGASIYNIMETIDPSYLAAAEQMGAALGSGFVVVDMFAEDYTRPMTPANYAFVEFNISPVILLFYSCRDGVQYDAVETLASMIDESVKQRNGAA